MFSSEIPVPVAVSGCPGPQFGFSIPVWSVFFLENCSDLAGKKPTSNQKISFQFSLNSCKRRKIPCILLHVFFSFMAWKADAPSFGNGSHRHARGPSGTESPSDMQRNNSHPRNQFRHHLLGQKKTSRQPGMTTDVGHSKLLTKWEVLSSKVIIRGPYDMGGCGDLEVGAAKKR